jgi:glycine hydroxymethyltransferase
VFPGVQGGPLMHVIAAKAVAFHEAMQPEFGSYQRAVVNNAKALAEELGRLGMRLVTGGTDNHIVMVDVSNIGMTGAAAALALEAAGITANKNAIPFDTRPPRIASGIRLGTPAVTSRGFGPEEMRELAQLIVRRLSHPDDAALCDEIRTHVAEMCRTFPVPGLAE